MKLEPTISDPARKSTAVFYGLVDSADSELLLSLLSPEEKITAEKKHKNHKNTYIASKAFLRLVLSNYLDKHPHEIQFSYLPNGKPCLKGNEMLNLCVAHTENIIVIGISLDGLIGVDIENKERKPDFGKLSGSVFSENELKKIEKLKPRLQQVCLINCWTRKEAVLKAMGSGLSFPMNQLDVTFFPDEKPEFLSASWSAYENNTWHLDSFVLFEKYVCAVALKGVSGPIELMNFEELFFPHMLPVLTTF